MEFADIIIDLEKMKLAHVQNFNVVSSSYENRFGITRDQNDTNKRKNCHKTLNIIKGSEFIYDLDRAGLLINLLQTKLIY